jgi:STE24 endopeptidase
MEWNAITSVFAALLGARLVVEAGVDGLQLRYLLRRGDRVPSHLEGRVDPETVRKAVCYNVDKLRLALLGHFQDAALLVLLVAAGFRGIEDLVDRTGLEPGSLASGLAFLLALMVAVDLWSLPVSLWSVFGVEARHGFNRRTPRAFAADRLKQLVLSLLLGGTVAAAVLLLIENGGRWWWALAFAAVAAIQLFVAWIHPLVIMPRFNRFSPVPADLAADVARLAGRVGFPLGEVVTMDSSRRSSHVNAFIVGLRGARRIVLFDTLIAKLPRPQLLAVLAHELGHFRLGHLRTRVLLALAGLGCAFALFGWLEGRPEAYTGLGFDEPSAHAALAGFAVLAAVGSFPFGWLLRLLSRRGEHAADRFAVEATGSGVDLAEALVALSRSNLASPGSHPWYRAWRNTHPALRHRLAAIQRHAGRRGFDHAADRRGPQKEQVIRMADKPIVKRIESVEAQEVARSRGASIRVLLGPGDGMPNFHTRLFTLLPGGRIPAHVHAEIEHEQVVLEGEMALTFDGERRVVRAGDAVYIPAGVAHSYENTGTAAVRFLCMIPATETYSTEFIEDLGP